MKQTGVLVVSLTKSKKLVLVAREVCRELRKNSMQAERLFWEIVRDRRLRRLKFYRQHPIFVDCDGHETFFVADFYCHEKEFVVELDGRIHEYQKYKDERRETILRNMGIRIVRFRNEEIESDIAKVIERLVRIIDE